MFSKSIRALDMFRNSIWIGGNMHLNDLTTHFANWNLDVHLQISNTNSMNWMCCSHGDQGGQMQSRCTQARTHTHQTQCIAYMNLMCMRALFCAHRTCSHAPFNAHISLMHIHARLEERSIWELCSAVAHEMSIASFEFASLTARISEAPFTNLLCMTHADQLVDADRVAVARSLAWSAAWYTLGLHVDCTLSAPLSTNWSSFDKHT